MKCTAKQPVQTFSLTCQFSTKSPQRTSTWNDLRDDKPVVSKQGRLTVRTYIHYQCSAATTGSSNDGITMSQLQ